MQDGVLPVYESISSSQQHLGDTASKRLLQVTELLSKEPGSEPRESGSTF